MTRISPLLPKDHDANGLDSLNSTLVKDPESEHILICVVDCKQVLIDIDTGMEEATARILRVEVVTDTDKAAADRMLAAGLHKRTGKSVLPFES